MTKDVKMSVKDKAKQVATEFLLDNAKKRKRR